MKKIFTLIVAALAITMSAQAQTNIQEMYDFNREHPTTTLEMFKGDNWGSTFFFVDIYHTKNIAPTDFYAEIARSLNFWKDTPLSPFSAHVEWNGGCGVGYMVNNAWLYGIDYFMHSADYNNTLTLEAMYKDIRGGSSDVPMQFTAVWGMKDIFNVTGLNFSGFADFWWENIQWDLTNTTSTVFISEPQLWYNVGQHFNCDNLNIGGEVEISNNFSGNVGFEQGWQVNPALGLKWVF